MPSSDLYEILGISRTASDDAIAKEYKKLAKQYHPDLNPGDKSAEDKFKKIAAAYEILGNHEKEAVTIRVKSMPMVSKSTNGPFIIISLIQTLTSSTTVTIRKGTSST